LATNILLYIKL